MMTSPFTAAIHLPSGRDDARNVGRFRVGQSITVCVESIDSNGTARLRGADLTIEARLPVAVSQGATIKLVITGTDEDGLILATDHSHVGEKHSQFNRVLTANPKVIAREGLLNALIEISAGPSAGGFDWQGSTETLGRAPRDRNFDLLGSGYGANGDGPSEDGDPIFEQIDAKSLNSTAVEKSPPLPPSEHKRSAMPISPVGVEQDGEVADKYATLPMAILPYQVPERVGPLEVAIYSGRSAKGTQDGERAIKSSFTFASNDLGQIHVFMRQCGSALSVRLCAERPEVATELLQERGELWDVLREADFVIEALEIFAPGGLAPEASPKHMPVVAIT